MERDSCGQPGRPVVLYDLKHDIGEKTNVADQHPEIAEKIGRYLTTARSDSPDWQPQW